MTTTRKWHWAFVFTLLACLEPMAMAQPVDEMQATRTAAARYEVVQERPDRLVVVLPNRLIVIAQELHASPVVSAQILVKTGSIYEQQHVGAGLSHFLEHLVSSGSTDERTEAQSNALLSRIGAQTNASTGLSNVRYYINTTSRHTADAIDLLSDWLQHSQITPREYERERSVIEREFEMGRGDPNRIFWRLTQQARYRFHPARHPTIGYIDEFLAISRDEIFDFYKRMYVPNNMIFVVAGDIDKQQVVEQIAALWRDAPARPLPELKFPVEPMIDARTVTASADIRRPRVRLVWPGTQLAGEGDYALDLLAVILGQGESSRLVRSVRDEHQAVNAVTAFNLSFSWGTGFFGMDAETADIAGEDGAPLPPEAAVAAVKELLLQQVAAVKEGGVTAEELARAKRQVLASVTYEGQSVQALAGQLSADTASMGDPDYSRRYAERIQAVTADELLAAAHRFLVAERLITVRLMPMEAGTTFEEPTRPADAQPGPEVAFTPIELDNTVLIEQMAALAAQPAAEVEPIVVDPVQRFELSNGLTVLIGRSTLVPAVSMQMYQRGGLLADEPGREGVNKAIAEMRVRGTATRSAEQIAALSEDLGARVSTDSASNTSSTTAVCLKQDLPVVMELFADVVLNPSFSEDEWQKLRPRLLAGIDRQTDSWAGELRKHFRETYFQDHPWALLPLGRREVVAELTADALADAYRQRLDAEETVLAIFGDVEVEAALDLVRRHFSSLPRLSAESTIPVRAAPTATMRQVSTVKPLGAVQIGFGPGITRTDPDYPAIEVVTRILSRFPSGWLEQQLRGEGEGLVYAVGSGQLTGFARGYVAILFNATPERLPVALERTTAVVQRIRDELVDEQTLADAKAAVLSGEFLGRQSNSERAASSSLDHLYGLGLDASETFVAQVHQLDAATIRAVARQYLAVPVTVVMTHQPLDPAALDGAAKGLAPATTDD